MITSCINPFAKKNPSPTYTEDMVAKGWRLIQRWDFYNELDGWNHETITRLNSGGFIKVDNGVLEFGYSKDGGTIYHKSNTSVIPNKSYMVRARVKTENPFRAFVGFMSPESKDLRGAVRIRSKKWHIVTAILSLDPTTKIKEPKKLYPAIRNVSRYDYTYVDWVEFWIFPRKKDQ